MEKSSFGLEIWALDVKKSILASGFIQIEL